MRHSYDLPQRQLSPDPIDHLGYREMITDIRSFHHVREMALRGINHVNIPNCFRSQELTDV